MEKLNDIEMKDEQKQKRKPYEKPSLKEVKLYADQVLGPCSEYMKCGTFPGS